LNEAGTDEAMTAILYTYLAGALLVASRLGWHMLRRLDGYDWHFNKLQIWTTFIFFSVLWPLTAFRPKALLSPSTLFEDDYDLAARTRTRDQLWTTPPACEAIVTYKPENEEGDETFGEFHFHASNVERFLLEKLQEHPHLARDEEGALLNWVQSRNEAQHHLTPVPSAWTRFKYVADDLIRAGEGKVRCLQCRETFPTGALVPKDDRGRPGWNFARLICPRGHPLLVIEAVHLLMKKKSRDGSQ